MKNLKIFFEKYGFKLNSEQEEQFEKYFFMLIETNKFMNLTSIVEENEVIIKHFIDSILPVEKLLKNSTVVDIGSGAGFPALPIKIMRPDLKIEMVDSLNKRISFLDSVIKELKLQNITSQHARAEEFAKKKRESFDYAVARAVASLNTLVEYLLPFLKIGGSAVIYKSSKLEEEIELAQNAIKILGGKIVEVCKFDLEGQERNILIIKKVSKTPEKYPRGQNKPKTNPI